MAMTAPIKTIAAFPLAADGRLTHFGGATQFALLEIIADQRAVPIPRLVPAPPHEPGSFTRWLREWGAQIVVAASIGQRALDHLHHLGVEVRLAPAGTAMTELAAGVIDGRWSLAQEGCHRQHGVEAPDDDCRLATFRQT